MENIYAAMLLHKAGKEINEETVTNVLTAAGITIDQIQVKALVATVSWLGEREREREREQGNR